MYLLSFLRFQLDMNCDTKRPWVERLERSCCVASYLRVPSVRRGKRSPIGGNWRREGGGGPPLADAALDVPELPAERHDAVVRHIGDIGRRAHGRGAKVPPVQASFSTRVGCALIAFLDFISPHSATCRDAEIKSVFLLNQRSFRGFPFSRE